MKLLPGPAFGVAALACVLALASFSQEKPSAPAQGELQKLFAAQGIHLDVEGGWCSIPARVLVREDLLEYALVNPHGQAHESMFVTEVLPSTLNVALLALNLKPGRNASWKERDPKPTPEEIRDGASAYQVVPPTGDGVYFYAGWKAGDETYWFRVEDLLLDRQTGQTMQRHKWVYLGSRMVQPRADKSAEAFAADLEGNLVNVALFEQGNTLFTSALSECLSQTIWMTNFWLVPQRDAQVELVFSRERLVAPPSGLEPRLPVVAAEVSATDGR